MFSLPKSEWLRGLLDFVFPPLCLGCGEYTEEEFAVCGACLEAIDTFDHPFCLNCLSQIPAGRKCPACAEKSVPVFAYGNYTPPLEQIIIQFKFKGTTRVSRMLAGLIVDRFGHWIEALDADRLVPIPLHSGRETYRGYNQAEVLASELSKRLSLELDDRTLVRARKRHPQARLGLRQREKNIRGVFAAEENFQDNSRIVLVDDVVTSGSTVREALRTVDRAGGEVVGVIAVAHAN